MENNNLIYIESFMKPVRRMLEFTAETFMTTDGEVLQSRPYSIYPPMEEFVDNIPLLNVYGQKIYNDFMENKFHQREEEFNCCDFEENNVVEEEEEEDNGDIRCDYSDL